MAMVVATAVAMEIHSTYISKGEESSSVITRIVVPRESRKFIAISLFLSSCCLALYMATIIGSVYQNDETKVLDVGQED